MPTNLMKNLKSLRRLDIRRTLITFVVNTQRTLSLNKPKVKVETSQKLKLKQAKSRS